MVNVSLSNSADFLSLKDHTIENVVTKIGCKPFPRFDFKISGLDPKASYQIFLSIQSVNKVEYTNDTWIPDKLSPSHYKEHPVLYKFGTETGDKLMQCQNLFPTLMFTNDLQNVTATTILLEYRHKYIPVIKVYPMKQNSSEELEKQEPIEFKFEEAAFVAVPRYRNREMHEKKMRMNKFSQHLVTKRAYGGSEASGEPMKKICVPPKNTPILQGHKHSIPVVSNPNAAFLGNCNYPLGSLPAILVPPIAYSGLNFPQTVSYVTTTIHFYQPVPLLLLNNHVQHSNRYPGVFSVVQQVYSPPLQFQCPAPPVNPPESQQHSLHAKGAAQQSSQDL